MADIVGERVKTAKTIVEPVMENLALYDSLQERFNSLWKTLVEEFKAHRQIES
jgi:3-methyladenine DNA glycosylase AlkD